MEFTQPGRPPIRRRLQYLGLCWLGIFLVTMGVDLFTPFTAWGGLVRLPVNFVVGPAAMLTAQYFLVSPRSAKRYWLILRFVLANWGSVNTIVSRHTKDRVRHPRRTIYPFWWTKRRDR